MKIKEFLGYDGFRAMQTFCKLVLGLKMLPMYEDIEYQDFLNIIHKMDEPDKRKVLRDGFLLVDLSDDEVLSLCSFAYDKNGVPISKNSFKSLTIPEIIDIQIEVCLKLSEIKVDSVTEDQKKK